LFSGNLIDAQTAIVPFVTKISTDDYNICQSAGEVVVSSVMSKSVNITQGYLQPDMMEKIEIYIPNVFAPDMVGDDKLFEIGVQENTPVFITRFIIINNYNDIVYEVSDIDPNNFTEWWDGTSGGKKVDNGVYRYQIEYTARGISDFRKGTITKL